MLKGAEQKLRNIPSTSTEDGYLGESAGESAQKVVDKSKASMYNI